jgi:hypothetical protein
VSAPSATASVLCAEVLKKNAVDEPTLMLVLKTSGYLPDVCAVDQAEIKRARRRARREEREAVRTVGGMANDQS